MKLILLFLSATFGFITSSHAQTTINLHSITTNRMPYGDNGYTFDGSHMTGSRAKLLATTNFGSAGTYNKNISITDAYVYTGDLEFISYTPNIDLFYFGIFNSLEPSLNAFIDAELDSLYDWSVRGGKMIIGAASPWLAYGFNPNFLNSRWNFDLALIYPTTTMPTTFGSTTLLYNGPFGTISSANQGGGSQGYFTNFPTDIVLLADDGAGNPTVYLDCTTLDLVLADGDMFTDLGGISAGNIITSNNDIFMANAIAYMDTLQDPPTITQNGNIISTGVYASYQWFLNGNAIPGATGSSHTMSQPGTYSVQVPLDCGCTNVASKNTVILVGIDELTESQISISPNPSSEVITINGLNNMKNIKGITVSNVKGAIVSNLLPINSELNVSALAKGVYFLNITHAKGINTIKFIKE